MPENTQPDRLGLFVARGHHRMQKTASSEQEEAKAPFYSDVEQWENPHPPGPGNGSSMGVQGAPASFAQKPCIWKPIRANNKPAAIAAVVEENELIFSDREPETKEVSFQHTLQEMSRRQKKIRTPLKTALSAASLVRTAGPFFKVNFS